MTEIERIHELFNELHKELVSEVARRIEGESLEDMTPEQAKLAGIAFKIDALHHDFAELTQDPALIRDQITTYLKRVQEPQDGKTT